MPKLSTNDVSELHLRVFTHHGVDVSRERNGQREGTCPFCGALKFSVQADSGLWRCWVCGCAGNPLEFVRLLWQRSDAATNGASQELSDDRKFLDRTRTMTEWGVSKSISDGSWLVPGYSVHDGRARLDQLYRRTKVLVKGEWRWVLLPTPGLWTEGKSHALHMPSQHWDDSRPRVDVFEGPWDGMAYWEIASQCRRAESGRVEFCGDPRSSLVADSNVFSVPGCNAWREEWTALCRGRSVTLWYDCDHPREYPPGSGNVVMPGRDGAKRVAEKLHGAAKDVRWLCWGGGGYDAALPSGFDVRDALVRGLT